MAFFFVILSLSYPIYSVADIYVADYYEGKVSTYDEITFKPINTSLITGLNKPTAITIGGDGNIYVFEEGLFVLSKYNSSTGQVISRGFITTDGPAYGVAIDESGYIYISEFTRDRVRKYSNSGEHISAWSLDVTSPTALIIDGKSNIYVSQYSQGTVIKYTISDHGGNEKFRIDGLSYPFGLSTSEGALYISELGYGYISKYDSQDGSQIQRPFVSGLNLPYYNLVARDHSLYVSDFGDGTVLNFDDSLGSVSSVKIIALGGSPLGLAMSHGINPAPIPSLSFPIKIITSLVIFFVLIKSTTKTRP